MPSTLFIAVITASLFFFACDEDIKAYAYWLREYAEKFEVSIHAWVFMTNHVHLLCTPSNTTGISKMM
jgi:putative transposase|tara:strand:- start:578 stop:781 length:204 start_codon:yes stop_codon:yes gene_type:complete